MKQPVKHYRTMEVRAAEDPENKGMIVEGYAIRFNEPAVIGIGEYQFKEVVSPRALDKADMVDVPFKYNHSNDIMIMARTRNKTLQLIKDEKGLFIRATLADITAGRDLYTLIQRGDIDKMSFVFSLHDNGDEYDSKTRTRTLTSISRIWDVAAVDMAAYNSTSISARSFFELESEKERRALESLELRSKLLALKAGFLQTH